MRLRHHRLAGLFAAHARGEADLRGGAKEAWDLLERADERAEEAGFEQHVVVQQADVRIAGARDAAVDGGGERERVRRNFHPHLRPFGGQPWAGTVARAVVRHDDFRGRREFP
jgi:hypothetical protein